MKRKLIAIALVVTLVFAVAIPAMAMSGDELAEIKGSIDGKIENFNSLKASFDSAKAQLDAANAAVEEANIIFDEANAGYEELLAEYETLKAVYENLKEDYEDGGDASYEDVMEARAAAEDALELAEAAFAVAKSALDDAAEAHEAASEAWGAANDILSAMAALLEEISGDIIGYNEMIDAENEEIDEENAAAWASYWDEMKAFAQEMADYLSVEAAKVAEYAKAVRMYNRELKAYNAEYAAYMIALGEYEAMVDAHTDWLREKELSGSGMSFKAGSKLLASNGTADVASYEPGNNSANGNKGKINPNAGEVKLAEGLYVISIQGSKQWAIRVEAEALEREFIFWAHGNVAGEFIKVTFYNTGTYLIGTSNGMNHLYMVGNLGSEPIVPEEPIEPEKPEAPEKPVPGNPPKFTAEMPECIPGLEKFIAQLGMPELGEVVAIGEMKTIEGLSNPPSEPEIPEVEEKDKEKEKEEEIVINTIRETPVVIINTVSEDPVDPEPEPEPEIAEEVEEVLGAFEFDPEEVPLAEYVPEEIAEEEEIAEIIDEEPPLAELPQTGASVMYILILVLGAAVTSIGVALVLASKKRTVITD